MKTIPRHVWIIFYSGPGQSIPTIDMLSVWSSKRRAIERLKVIKGNNALKEGYSVRKFNRDLFDNGTA